MKTSLHSTQRCKGNHLVLNWQKLFHKSQLLVFLILIIAFFAGCKKDNTVSVLDNTYETSGRENNVLNQYTQVSPLTMWELNQTRAATAKYRNIQNALRDGYVDINVDVENMGHHFMNAAYLDGLFDIRRPEILVYNNDDDGNPQLVAVEYAIPLDRPLPEGFTGSDDVWDGNAGFQLWLLHAWTWAYNPNGVFNSTNPLVHLH